MTYKEVVNNMIRVLLESTLVLSAAYGDEEDFDESKEGVDYPRAYISLDEVSSMNSYSFMLTITDRVDLIDRLSGQSSTLTIAKKVQLLLSGLAPEVFNSLDVTATSLYSGDQTEGWKLIVDITSLEGIDICDIKNGITWE